MARIRIKDIPRGVEVSREEMRKITGGLTVLGLYPTAATGGFSQISWGSGSQQYAGCGCMGMAQDPKEAGCSSSMLLP